MMSRKNLYFSVGYNLIEVVAMYLLFHAILTIKRPGPGFATSRREEANLFVFIKFVNLKMMEYHANAKGP